MSRIIASILEVPDIAFRQLLDDWEAKSEHDSHDVRLLSDIRVRSKHALDQLKLDQDDTTSEELYFALQDKATDDNRRLSGIFGISDSDSPPEVLDKIISWLSEQNMFRDVWAVKPSILKAALKKQPPKTLMKVLGLRSAESMLKRNSPAEILPLAYMLEKPEWTTKFRQHFKKLNPPDFQVREIVLCVTSGERMQKLKKAGFPSGNVVNPCNDIGSIMLIPPSVRFANDVLSITATLLEAVAEMRRQSAYIRALGVRGDFGERFFDAVTNGTTYASKQLSHFGWNSLHKHLVGNREFFSSIEQPHLSYDDLHISSPASMLGTLDPDFLFWEGLEHVFYVRQNEKPVSMHLIDVSTNSSNRTSYSNATIAYGQSRLWDELWSRYLQHPTISDQVIGKFLGEDRIDV